MARTIDTEIEIATAPERVWGLLMDFSSYPSWNPFIRRIEGDARLGGALEVTIEPSGMKAAVFKPRVVRCDSGRAFHWRGSLPIPGLFTGEHRFDIERGREGGTTLRQSEVFTGLLVPFVGAMLAATEKGFQVMNEAAKSRLEARA